jgi:hypothetical protein
MRGFTMRGLMAACVVVGVLVSVPSTVLAQASLTGIVRDTSGGVLPGVTVEAASPVLIERVRSAVSDGAGQYRIIDLRPGTYTVTFTLPGFGAVRREGIVLEGTFTATVNAELSIGNIAETITVSGESPIVDVQSVRRQTVVDSATIDAIPAAKSYGALLVLLPNTVAGNQSQVVPGMVVFGGAGGRINEGRLQLDGLHVGSAFNGAGVSAYRPDIGGAQEVVMTSSGGLGEAEVGGPSLNVLPREGGNSIRGSIHASGVSGGMVGDNYTQELRDRGLLTPGRFVKVWDFNGSFGGPVVRDRLWFYVQSRDEGSLRRVASMFANANEGNQNPADPNAFRYVPDLNRPAATAASYRTFALRLTGQATSRNKVSVFWDEQLPCEGAASSGAGGVTACRSASSIYAISGAHGSPAPQASPTLAPEAGTYRGYGQRVQQAKWTSPATNRLLLEAGFGTYRSRWGGNPMPGADTSLLRVVDQCNVTPVPGQPCEHGISNITFGAPNWASNINSSLTWNAAASYVVGRHSLKVGHQGGHLIDDRTNFTNAESMSIRLNNGVPNQVTMSISPFSLSQRVRYTAFFVQEQWTLGRVTLQGALRHDRAWSYYPQQVVGPVRFFPQEVVYPRTTGVEGYNDITPRAGLAMDVFGNGRTALKLSMGRYHEAAQNAGLFTVLNPTSRITTTASRGWTDTNGNYYPDCQLLVAAANGECNATNLATFGTPVFTSTLDPALTSGWGVRSGDWQWGASVQQEVAPRVSAELGYQRRWLVNFSVTDNLNRGPEDHDEFALLVPSDPRLPGGGGGSLGGLYNVTQAAFALGNDNFVTLDREYARRKNATDSIYLNVTARPRSGVMLQGGINTWNTNSDVCALRAHLPELTIPGAAGPTNPWCNTSSRTTRVTGLGSYLIPRIDVQVAGTFRSDQGPNLAANYTTPVGNTTLARPFVGVGGGTITVNLIEPGTLRGDRVNQIDLRFAKILRFARTRANVGLDVYNIINASPVLSYAQAFVPNQTVNTWLRPTSILEPRYVKFSATFDF